MCRKKSFNSNTTQIVKEPVDLDALQSAMKEQGLNISAKQVGIMIEKGCGTCANMCGAGAALNAAQATLSQS